MQLPAVKGVGFGGSDLASVTDHHRDPKWPGKPDALSVELKFSVVIKVYSNDGIELLSGRNFVDMNSQDSTNYIINKKAMEVMGLIVITCWAQNLKHEWQRESNWPNR